MCIHPHTIVLVRHREVCTHTHKCGTKFSTVPRFSKYQKSQLKFESTLKVLKFTQSTSLSHVSVGRPLNLAELHHEMRTRSQLTKMNCTLEINTLKVKSLPRVAGIYYVLGVLTAVSCCQYLWSIWEEEGDSVYRALRARPATQRCRMCIRASFCTFSYL